MFPKQINLETRIDRFCRKWPNIEFWILTFVENDTSQISDFGVFFFRFPQISIIKFLSFADFDKYQFSDFWVMLISTHLEVMNFDFCPNRYIETEITQTWYNNHCNISIHIRIYNLLSISYPIPRSSSPHNLSPPP